MYTIRNPCVCISHLANSNAGISLSVHEAYCNTSVRNDLICISSHFKEVPRAMSKMEEKNTPFLQALQLQGKKERLLAENAKK